jgi:hypothetical protein
MLNVKFNIAMGSTIIILSLLCCLIERLTIISFNSYLNMSNELNTILHTRLIQDFSFSQIDQNTTCTGISFSTLSDLTYCFNTIYSEITYYSYLKEDTIDNECNMFDSLMNRVYINNCLNSLFYHVRYSKSKIAINNIKFPIFFNNDTFQILGDDMFNVTIYNEDIFYTQVPEITYKILPGIQRECISDKMITNSSFNKLYQHIDSYIKSRRNTKYIQPTVLILSIVYVINILLFNNCNEVLKKSNLLIIIAVLILEYVCFLFFMSIYFKSYKIMQFSFNTLQRKCFDARLSENMNNLYIDAKMIHNCSLVIIIILFTKIVVLLYLLKIHIMLNLVGKRTISGTTPRYKSSNLSLSLELINKRSGMS